MPNSAKSSTTRLSSAAFLLAERKQAGQVIIAACHVFVFFFTMAHLGEIRPTSSEKGKCVTSAAKEQQPPAKNPWTEVSYGADLVCLSVLLTHPFLLHCWALSLTPPLTFLEKCTSLPTALLISSQVPSCRSITEKKHWCQQIGQYENPRPWLGELMGSLFLPTDAIDHWSLLWSCFPSHSIPAITRAPCYECSTHSLTFLLTKDCHCCLKMIDA